MDNAEEVGTEVLSEPIPLSEVNGHILGRILAWCEEHRQSAQKVI